MYEKSIPNKSYEHLNRRGVKIKSHKIHIWPWWRHCCNFEYEHPPPQKCSKKQVKFCNQRLMMELLNISILWISVLLDLFGPTLALKSDEHAGHGMVCTCCCSKNWVLMRMVWVRALSCWHTGFAPMLFTKGSTTGVQMSLIPLLNVDYNILLGFLKNFLWWWVFVFTVTAMSPTRPNVDFVTFDFDPPPV